MADPVSWARTQPVGGPAEYAVLVALAHEANELGISRRSVAEIAAEIRTDRSTTRRILGRLAGRGLVSWEQASRGERNTYQLPLSDHPV